MTPEETIEAGKVMIEAGKGKAVQCAKRPEGGDTRPLVWLDWNHTDRYAVWDWGNFVFRLKPEPRRWWMNVEANGSSDGVFLSQGEAEEDCPKHCTTIQVQEVMKDE